MLIHFGKLYKIMKFKNRQDSLDKIGIAISNGLTVSVVELCKIHLENDPESIAAQLYFADALIDLSKYNEAEELILKAIEKLKIIDRETPAFPFSQLGDLYRRKGEFHKAIEWYKKASEINADEASYYIFIGTSYFRLGNIEKAEKFLLKATDCDEGFIDEAFYNLGIILCSKGKYQNAYKYFQKAIEIDSEYEEAKHWIEDLSKILK